MDIFFTLISTWYFYELSSYYERITTKSLVYISMLLCIFIGPFFSYTFPIVIAPLMIGFFITFLLEYNNKIFSIKALLPIILFIISLCLNYYTDLQFVLHDKGQYHNFDMFVMNYSSVGLIWKGLLNIIWLFTSIFFFDKYYSPSFLYLLYIIKILVLIFSLLGFVMIFYNEIVKIKKPGFFGSLSLKKTPGIQIYFLLLFFITMFLYLVRMLPMGTHRINYFCFIYISYFFITGVFATIKKFNRAKYVLLPVIIFAAAFPAIESNICELKNTNLNFDQKIYSNVGHAINIAQFYSLPIMVSYNEFYPASIMEGQENLMIKAHHEYKPEYSVPVFVVKNGELNNLVDSLHLKNYLFLTKYNYQIFPKK